MFTGVKFCVDRTIRFAEFVLHVKSVKTVVDVGFAFDLQTSFVITKKNRVRRRWIWNAADGYLR